MISSVDTLVKKPYKDKQVSAVYKFDHQLVTYLDQTFIDMSLLEEGIKDDYDIIDLTHKILKDFGLSEFNVSRTSLADTYSFDNHIYYNDDHYSTGCIETVFHEVAHVIQSFLGGHDDYAFAHSGCFLSVLRMLFNHYDIISTKKFNSLVGYSNLKMELYDDYIIDYSIEKTTRTQHLEHISTMSNYKRLKLNSFFSPYTISFDLSLRGVIEHDDHKEIVVFDAISNKKISFKTKKLGFEKELNNRFSSYSMEELSGSTLFSPIASFDERKKRTLQRSIPSKKGFCFVNFSTNDSGKTIHNRYLFEDKSILNADKSINSSQTDLKSKLKDGILFKKDKGVVFVSSSWNEYIELLSSLLKEINKREVLSNS